MMLFGKVTQGDSKSSKDKGDAGEQQDYQVVWCELSTVVHLRHDQYIVDEVYFSGYCYRVKVYTNIKIVIQPTTHVQISERKG